MPDDEPRDWETLRSDAITAVREAARLSGPKAAAAADAILGVIDEETVRALCAEHVKNTMIRSMDFRNGANLELQPARDMIAYWVAAARTLLNGAENYSETTLEWDFSIPEDPQRYSFVVQKAGKLTPHEARRKAEAERDDARREVQRLLRQVRMLESDGGRIGFAVVTYNQASHWPEFDYPDLHTELQDAVNERDHKREETKRLERGERHVVAEVTELEEDAGGPPPPEPEASHE